MVPEAVTVRRLSSVAAMEGREWREVRELCCRTGNNGQPVSPERWQFFGRLWIEPYEKIVPQWTYVAEAGGGVVGYLTGCPDTRKFARARLRRFVLPLLIDIALGSYSRSTDARRFVRQTFRLERGPELLFPSQVHRSIAREYPAHLHMNVEASWRRLGVGTKLIGRYFYDLQSAGVSGVHLYCGADPLLFYCRQGFEELARVMFHGRPVYALGCRYRCGNERPARRQDILQGHGL